LSTGCANQSIGSTSSNRRRTGSGYIRLTGRCPSGRACVKYKLMDNITTPHRYRPPIRFFFVRMYNGCLSLVQAPGISHRFFVVNPALCHQVKRKFNVRLHHGGEENRQPVFGEKRSRASMLRSAMLHRVAIGYIVRLCKTTNPLAAYTNRADDHPPTRPRLKSASGRREQIKHRGYTANRFQKIRRKE